MVKALFDTNVLASGLASFRHPHRAPSKLLHAWRAGLFELCISEYILIELKETLNKPYFKNKLAPEDIEELVILLSEECAVIPVTATVKRIATHPEDDLVISAAISGKVDYLVTGDGPLLRKVGSVYRGVKLVTPNEFLTAIQE